MFGWRKQIQPGLVLTNPYLGLEGAPNVTVWKLFRSTFMASMAYSTWKSLPSGENVFTPLQGQHRQSEKGRKPTECGSLLKSEATWARVTQVGQRGRVPLSTGHAQGWIQAVHGGEHRGSRQVKAQVRSRWDDTAHCGCWKPSESKGGTRNQKGLVLPWNP